ncbi:basic amino acid ABC transporter substrate-binding protein [Coprothermobacteraceae bacterium]|nr:basic amino acid ABC transporter substrate-binding protein [Coprothermobacteraceae bacterium]
MKKILAVLLVVGLLVAGCTAKKTVQTLTVGTSADFPPFEFVDEQGKITGFDVELMNAVAEKMGYEVKWENADFAGLIASLQTGKYDAVISGMTITDERKKEVDFSDPYFRSDQSVAVQAGNTSITKQEDLVDKQVGVQLGTTGELLAREIVTKGKVYTYDNPDQAFLDLNTGRIDAVINDLPVTGYFLVQNPDLALKIAFVINTDEYYGIAVQKGNTELLNKINKAIKELRDEGKYAEIYKKWFSVEPTW